MTYVAGPPVVLKIRLNTTAGSSLIIENWIVLSVPGTEDSVPVHANLIDVNISSYVYVSGGTIIMDTL